MLKFTMQYTTNYVSDLEWRFFFLKKILKKLKFKKIIKIFYFSQFIIRKFIR